MIGGKSIWRQLITSAMAELPSHCHTIANLNPFDRIDTHHRMSNVRIQTIKHRLTQTDWYAACNDLKARTAARSLSAQAVNQGFKSTNRFFVSAKEWITIDKRPIDLAWVEYLTMLMTDLSHMTTDLYAQPLL